MDREENSPEPGHIDKAIDLINHITEVVDEAGGLTGRTADRLMGCVPTATEGSEKGQESSTGIERLNAALRRLNSSAMNAQSQSYRLNEL